MMRHALATFTIVLFAAQLGCAGCQGFGDDPDDRLDPNSRPPNGLDLGGGGDMGGAFEDTSAHGDSGSPEDGDAGTGADMAAAVDAGTDTGAVDMGGGMDLGPSDVCGDGMLTGAEVCDDGVTADCSGTHDGGNGSCVPVGTCASGYVLSGSSCVPNSTGLSEPCQNGSGFAMFRYHYSNNSTSAQIDVWDASCSYSFAPNSACNVYEICPGFCDPPTTSDGYPIFNSSNYMRVRFNANGLNFSQATLYIQARSYATSSSTNVLVESPLYGGYTAGPIDNDFVYDWYALDWTGYLYPNDQPSLTAIQLYGSSGSVAIKAVELCVE